MKNKLLKLLSIRSLEYLILLAILAGSFGIRLWKIQNPIADWHSWRQVDTASVARIYVDEGIDLLRPRYYDISSIQTGYINTNGYRFVEFPIYNLAHALGFLTLPQLGFEVWGRLISIFSAVTTLYFVYLIGKKTGGRIAGLLSGFFYGFLPFNVYFTRVILPEPMATMFAVMGVWFFMQYFDKSRKRDLFLSAIAFSLGLLIKPYIMFYALPVAYLVYKKYGIKNIFKNIPLLLALDIALIPLFAWRAWMGQAQFLVGIPHFAWVFNGDAIRFRPAFWRWIFGERLGNLILGNWGVAPFVYGLTAPDFKKKFTNVPLLMLGGMFLYVLVIATASVRHDYYQSIAIPAIALVLGLGARQMLNKKASSIVLLFCTFMMLGMSFFKIRDNYQINHYEFVEVGNIVDQSVPKDARVIAPDNGNTVFLYYTKRFGWPVLEENIDDVIAKKGADYFVSVNKNDGDTTNFRKRFETFKEGGNYLILDLNKPIK